MYLFKLKLENIINNLYKYSKSYDTSKLHATTNEQCEL